MPTIHSTAVVDPGAELAANVEIGAYSIIGPHVRLGEDTRVMPHAFIDGHTTMGKNNVVYPFASIGTQTQDLKYSGGITGVEIGDDNTFREYVTINAATDDGDATRIGSGCLFMVYSHVAHDCIVGDRVIIANCGTLAGHVIVEDEVVIGGLCGIHQFVRLGRLSITGGCSKVVQDVPPFMMADGHPLAIRGINTVGMKRRGFSTEVLRDIKEAYRILYRKSLTPKKAVDEIRSTIASGEEIEHLVDFVVSSERGIT